MDYQLLYCVLSDSVPGYRLSGCGTHCSSDGVEGLTTIHRTYPYATVDAVVVAPAAELLRTFWRSSAN